MGKKYKINLRKLLKRNSFVNDKKNKNGKSRHDDGYFCSELVAKAYKIAGILPAKKSACSYWPGKLIDSLI